MYTKAQIFNLALGALLLQRRITNTETDTSNEAKVLNTFYDTAFNSTLQDLDLDSTSAQVTLELLDTDPNDLWSYAYKYPTDCVFFRRIQTQLARDTTESRIPLRVIVHEGVKAIYTNEQEAIGEYISKDVPLSSLSASAGLCVAYSLAMLASPLITGKGAQKLREEIRTMYIVKKAEAQAQDRQENWSSPTEYEESEFVRARIE